MRTPHHGGDLIAAHAVFGVYSTVSSVTSIRSCGHILRQVYEGIRAARSGQLAARARKPDGERDRFGAYPRDCRA